VRRFYSIRPKLQRDEDAIRTKKSQLSSFVLVTNILDEEAWPDERILKEYKEQTVVEQHFSFIKSPKVVGAIYLKNPERVAALAYVFLMALLVYSLIQRRARRALKGQERPLIIYDKRKTFEPTGRSVLDLFTNMMVADVDGKRVLPSNLKLPEHALRLLGFSEDVYLRWTPP
jgi:Transposase